MITVTKLIFECWGRALGAAIATESESLAYLFILLTFGLYTFIICSIPGYYDLWLNVKKWADVDNSGSGIWVYPFLLFAVLWFVFPFFAVMTSMVGLEFFLIPRTIQFLQPASNKLKSYRQKAKRDFQKLDKVQQWINYCKIVKYFGLTSSLVGAGLALKFDDENFTKSATSFALISSFTGLTSEAIKELILEPQKEKLQEKEQRIRMENYIRELTEQENQQETTMEVISDNGFRQRQV